MNDILQKICKDKLNHIKNSKQLTSIAELETRAARSAPTRGFLKNLRASNKQRGIALIAELKKASPSKGIIRTNFNPVDLAQAYECGGATCLSVLTDTPYFSGNDIYLERARTVVGLPILRKDFMLDPYQIIESRALGADCILLIMAALSDDQASELKTVAESLQMDVLIEIHSLIELNRALKLKPLLIGINNRNLQTLEVNLQTSEKLFPGIPNDCHVICESGIHTAEDVKRIQRVGIRSFLVGESLMLQEDVTLATRTFISWADKNK